MSAVSESSRQGNWISAASGSKRHMICEEAVISQRTMAVVAAKKSATPRWRAARRSAAMVPAIASTMGSSPNWKLIPSFGPSTA